MKFVCIILLKNIFVSSSIHFVSIQSFRLCIKPKYIFTHASSCKRIGLVCFYLKPFVTPNTCHALKGYIHIRQKLLGGRVSNNSP